jgi:hypothetical protein
MTGSSARNHPGIFKNNKAKLLASKYELDLNNPNVYIHFGKYITYSDVSFMVENLWLNHFMYNDDKPLELSYDEYDDLFYSLQDKYPALLNFSFA